MKITASSPTDYISKVTEDRKIPMQTLRKIILDNLDDEFEETMNYGMIGYVVPHSIYPDGYHCDPKTPLPFMSIAHRKNFIAVYHMGLYADKDLFEWFQKDYAEHSKYKLDMGKSCIRFKKVDDIPYTLIGELVSKMNAQQWIKLYEKNVKRK